MITNIIISSIIESIITCTFGTVCICLMNVNNRNLTMTEAIIDVMFFISIIGIVSGNIIECFSIILVSILLLVLSMIIRIISI